jgi:hypothetical protein
MTDKELVDPELFKISEVGLSVVGKPTFDQIQDEFIKWALVHRVSAFALGDLLVYSERRWGETYAQLSAITTLSPEYLYNVKYVCEKVPFNRRRESLSFSHHQAIASIKEPADQARWLYIAEKDELTRDELRKEIARDADPSAYISLRTESLKVPEPTQTILNPPELDLRNVVSIYILARRLSNGAVAAEAYKKMETLVEDLL